MDLAHLQNEDRRVSLRISTFYRSSVSFKDNAKFEFICCWQDDPCQRVLVSMVRHSSATVAKLDVVEEQCCSPDWLMAV